MNKEIGCYFSRHNRCTALADKYCKDCAFFKTEDEVKKSREVATERLKTLPARTQLDIYCKYYSTKGGVVR